MTDSIRVLLCDDSSTMRRLIKTALKAKPNIEVVYEAKDGLDAVKNFAAAKPDIVVMDIEMPVMDGIDATTEIRRQDSALPIVMFSSLTSRGAEATLDALAAGANDFAVKPTASGHINDALKQLETELVPKILELVSRSISRRPVQSENVEATVTKKGINQKVDGIAIGVSTGGPDALCKLLAGVPKKMPVPIFIAQHMPPVFTTRLATRLATQTGHNVKEAVNDELVIPGQVLLAPGDFHMTVHRRGQTVLVRLNQDRHENSCRPAVDPLFRSMADCYGANTLGVILTGMGQDGMQGSSAIKSNGGSVIVQDKESSVVWGMPGKVVQAGQADAVLSLDQIAIEMAKSTKHAHCRFNQPVSGGTR